MIGRAFCIGAVSRFFLLTKHFFRRLLLRDSLPYEEGRRSAMIFQVSGFAMFTTFIANELFKKYLSGRARDLSGLPFDKTLFLTLMMTAIGMISVFLWKQVTLDSRDRANLSPLPLAAATLTAAKFCSLLAWISVFTVAGSLLAAPLYGHYVGSRTGGALWQGGSFFLTLWIANMTTFLSIAALQGLVVIALGESRARRLATVLQMALLLGFLAPLAGFVRIVDSTGVFLPFWFSRWHDRLTTGAVARGLDPGAVIFSLLGACIFIYFLALIRQLNVVAQNGEQYDRRRIRPRPRLGALLIHHPLERAIDSFFVKTLIRGSRQALQMLLVLTIPVAYMAGQLLITISDRDWQRIHIPSFGLAYMPLALLFFTLLAVRFAVRQPLAPGASHIFLCAIPHGQERLISGLHKALIFRFVLPLTAATGILLSLAWGALPGCLYSLYTLSLAVTMQQALFHTYLRVPFTSPLIPDQFKIKLFWPLYLMGYSFGLAIFGHLGVALCIRPVGLAVFLAVAAGLNAALWRRRKRLLSEMSLRFEAAPEPAIMGLTASG